jgi:hypothetical protein
VRNALVIVAALSVACREPAPIDGTDPAQVLAEIQREGADSVAHRMDRDDSFGERVLDGIGSGDSTWLNVAVALRPTGAADISESLPITVAEALPKSPDRVLALIQAGKFSTEEVCTIPFIEPSDSLVAAYYAETMRALTQVARADLAGTRDRCMAALEKANSAAPTG